MVSQLKIGFYAQINSPEDAKARVVDYALVMARPMVLYQADHPIHWSPVFIGGPSGNIGYVNEKQRRLVTTVSTPVFDRRNHTVRAANLLGVVGADVSIEEIVKMIPQYKVSNAVVFFFLCLTHSHREVLLFIQWNSIDVKMSILKMFFLFTFHVARCKWILVHSG